MRTGSDGTETVVGLVASVLSVAKGARDSLQQSRRVLRYREYGPRKYMQMRYEREADRCTTLCAMSERANEEGGAAWAGDTTMSATLRDIGRGG